jgi:hypothetical protein
MSTEGLVTSFSPHDGDRIFVDGMPYRVEHADRPWSITNPDSDTLRFELRSGDVWHQDAPAKERTGIGGEDFFAAGKDVSVTYEFMIEPGDPNTSEWLLIGQFHPADGFSSPPFAVELIGEELAIKLRYRIPGEQVYQWYEFQDDEPIVRGKYYKFHAEFDVEPNQRNSGSVKVWLDGEQIVDYSGYLGYGSSFYWKADLYRAAAPETIAVNYRGMSLEGELGVDIYGTEHDDRIDPDHRVPGQPKMTTNGDIINGFDGADTIRGSSGNDILIGDGGGDLLKGASGGDTLIGGAGKDELKGANGDDTFYFDAKSGKDVIRDFEDGTDMIALPGELFGSVAELLDNIHKVDGGVELDLPGKGLVFIKHINPGQITEHDFLVL